MCAFQTSIGLQPDCTLKSLPKDMDLNKRVIPMEANDVKPGMWVIDDKSGVPGIVSDLKKVKVGKHGHCKVMYKLKMTHSGKTAFGAHHSTEMVFRAVMDKVDYLFSYLDGSGESFFSSLLFFVFFAPSSKKREKRGHADSTLFSLSFFSPNYNPPCVFAKNRFKLH